MWLHLNMLASLCPKSLWLELVRSLPLNAVGMEHKGCSSLYRLLWDCDSKWELMWFCTDFITLLYLFSLLKNKLQ